MIVCNILIDFVLSIIEVDNLIKLVMFVIEGMIIDIINYRLFLFHFVYISYTAQFFMQNSKR